MEFQSVLSRVASGVHLSIDEMTFAIDQLMTGSVVETEMAEFLSTLHAKGETSDEIAGAAIAMRRHMTPIRSQRDNVIDTCGTGGVGSKLFNVSTSAAIVVAACGVPVAKHGNRNFTSKSGSANVLSELGVNIDAPVTIVERCLNELGICFCFAPRLHTSMRHVGPVRQKLGTPTIFNLLGPLCNPASARYQLMGVGRNDLRPLLASVLAKLGTTRAAVVSGEGGLGEVTVGGPTYVSFVDGQSIQEQTWQPSDFGLPLSDLSGLSIDGPAASATIIRSVLAGERGAARNMVVINAAAAISIVEPSQSLSECTRRAEGAIDSGKAAALLKALAAMSHTN